MRFSVIIPAYHAEHTLARCLNSILGQSFCDFQVIVVDDGSTDGTGTIARAYARQDRRFSLLTMPHAGTGAARNRGLEQATGEYVLYMDADDFWAEQDLLERLEGQILREVADVYMYQMVKVTEDGGLLPRYTKPPFRKDGQVLPLRDVYFDLVRDGQTLASACNKCVRRDLLLERNIQFREDVIGEDIDWVLRLFSNVQTICLLNLNAYAYTQHKGESRSRHPDAANDLVTIIDDWSGRVIGGGIHAQAVAGLIAFEYGICMGSCHRLSRKNKACLRKLVGLLEYGLDRKTILICKFYRMFGFALTCLAIRAYLFQRRIW